MHSLFTYLEDNPSADVREEPRFHEMSHGESFLAVLWTRTTACARARTESSTSYRTGATTSPPPTATSATCSLPESG